MTDARDFSVLEKHIIGRVTPHIYAFSTESVPSHLKVGDTYRPVAKRLAEWKQKFPDLKERYQAPATLGDQQDTYFRDYSVHEYLETNSHARLQPEDVKPDVYYSREFFRDATPEDVKRAIEDIKSSYKANDARYILYDAASTLPQTHIYTRSSVEWELRPNQEKAVENFQKAVKKGRTNLLMYAVMRFGKSFTSLACAKRMKAKSVVIVSAKADVMTEWKKTTEIPANFGNFRFLTTRELCNDDQAITKTVSNGEVPIVFLTLQDLQGSDVKERHKQVFSNKFDLLIIDESHYGARAQSYGQVLRGSGLPEETKKNQDKELEDTVDPDEADTLVKTLDANVRLHLSGTPYRILMGSEFEPEDIVAFVQFSDIVQEQESWDRENLNNDDVNEWDNPYFGFPQMVRFAFNLNESSRARIEQLRSQGISATLSALLQPQSVKLDTNGIGHKKFKHEVEVLDLLRVIDGSQSDPNILGFLDYDKIKDGNMCRHMVMVLPYKASCDAMEALLANHAGEFKNLADYEVLNISGLTTKKNLRDTEDVKTAISNAEAKGAKTITLTVNKMLTGSTVEQWDTMLFLKDTSSPQEYDQAIFRLQNQYVRELKNGAGQDVIRHCLKPQTLLIDFDPTRMFRMQEQKSLIYNVNTNGRGNDELEDRLEEELRISPVITLNSGLIKEVKPTDILQAISNYNADRTITDEVMDLPVDLGLLENEDLRRVINAQAEIGSRKGMETNPYEGKKDTADIPSASEDSDDTSEDNRDNRTESKSSLKPIQKDEIASLEKKMRTYYQRILFFAMLAQNPVNSLGDIIDSSTCGDHPRILKNLELDPELLKLFKQKIDPFKLSQLDYKIQNISHLIRDDRFTPVDRAERAIGKFSRISEYEIRTPSWLCDNIFKHMPAGRLKRSVLEGEKILDIASKFGEFSLSAFKYLMQVEKLPANIASNAIYSLPTSPTAYEFTRKFYEIIGLNQNNIIIDAISHDLLNIEKNNAVDIEELKKLIPLNKHHENSINRKNMRFAAVVGNPPFHLTDGGAQASAKPIYHHFASVAEELSTDFVALIIPTRWYTGGKGLSVFRKHMLETPHIRVLVDQLQPDTFFPDTNNRGGICYYLMDKKFNNVQSKGVTIYTFDGHLLRSKSTRKLDSFKSGIFIRDSIGVEIASKVMGHSDFSPISNWISSRQPFRIPSKIENIQEFHTEQPANKEGFIRCFVRRGNVGWVPRSMIKQNIDWIDRWKIMMPYANNIGTELKDDNQNTFVASPGSVCSETFLVVGGGLDLSEKKAYALSAYLRTRFARFLLSVAKISQHGTRQTYRFVPTPDLGKIIDFQSDLDAIDEYLFKHFELSESQQKHIRSSISTM